LRRVTAAEDAAMTDHIADRLCAACDATDSIACVGLDPRPHLLPPSLVAEACSRASGREAVAAAFTAFNRGIIDAIAGRCPVVKPQVACYEAYGAPGIAALEATIAHAHARGLQVIVDGKRNDIGSTVAHYRQAWLSVAPGLDGEDLPGAGGDWLTVNAYLGSDGVTPLLSDPPGATGIFVLVKTSNPGSAELQDQPCGEQTVMETMASLVATWGRERRGACALSDIGAVVGATWPDEARALRALMPDTLFLVPGYGAQGAGAADAVAGARSDGHGCLINSSRGIIGAWQQASADGHDWQQAIRAALETMNRDLNAVR
jgi:orotidine-5'-phosphate decarboxylase